MLEDPDAFNRLLGQTVEDFMQLRRRPSVTGLD